MKIATAAAAGLLLTVAGVPLIAGGHPGPKPVKCDPGCEWVLEESFTEVVRLQCKVVPDVKKVRKVSYSTKDDPFCVQKCGKCDVCKGPYTRKILVKTETVIEEPTTKCVVEKFVELVPCKVWKQVPCQPATTVPPAPK